MTPNGVIQILLFFALITAGDQAARRVHGRVFEGERTLLSPLFRPVEKLFYGTVRRARRRGHEVDDVRVRHADVQRGRPAADLCAAAPAGAFAASTRKGFSGKDMTPDLAFNTADSFTTNTNWQSYVPETTVSYFSNMVSLAIHNWMSAATGMAIAIALGARLRAPLGATASATSGWT